MKNNSPNIPAVPLPNPGEGGPVYPGGDRPPAPGEEAVPVLPLPNPGEGGPVYPGPDPVPVIPLPNPGEGGPVYPGPDPVPVIPLPNPGEGGAVYPGGPGMVVLWPRAARVRFLNAAYGYNPFRILINNFRTIRVLNFASVTAYGRVPVGYQTVTVMGMDGYVYIRKTMPFHLNAPCTVAIINTPGGLDLLQIPDSFPASNGCGSFRVSNLALNSRPMDVLLGDGRVVFSDVRYKETTVSKRIRPGAYQFFLAETNLAAMPQWQDIETLDSAFLGMTPPVEAAASIYLNARANSNYTAFILPGGTPVNAVQTLVVEDR